MNGSKKKLRALLARIQQLQEEERSRLARTIHDDLSQKLTALAIELSLLQKRLGGNREAKVVADTLQLTTEISGAVKKTINELRSGVLDQSGIVAAIKSECQRLCNTQACPVIFSSTADDVFLSKNASIELFRAVQELIVQMIAAKARKITVQLQCRANTLQVVVCCSPVVKNENELDLALMAVQERLERVAGKLKKGTKGAFTLQVPRRSTN